jgi:hypothetical protein
LTWRRSAETSRRITRTEVQIGIVRAAVNRPMMVVRIVALSMDDLSGLDDA